MNGMSMTIKHLKEELCLSTTTNQKLCENQLHLTEAMEANQKLREDAIKQTKRVIEKNIKLQQSLDERAKYIMIVEAECKAWVDSCLYQSRPCPESNKVINQREMDKDKENTALKAMLNDYIKWENSDEYVVAPG